MQKWLLFRAQRFSLKQQLWVCTWKWLATHPTQTFFRRTWSTIPVHPIFWQLAVELFIIGNMGNKPQLGNGATLVNLEDPLAPLVKDTTEIPCCLVKSWRKQTIPMTFGVVPETHSLKRPATKLISPFAPPLRNCINEPCEHNKTSLNMDQTWVKLQVSIGKSWWSLIIYQSNPRKFSTHISKAKGWEWLGTHLRSTKSPRIKHGSLTSVDLTIRTIGFETSNLGGFSPSFDGGYRSYIDPTHSTMGIPCIAPSPNRPRTRCPFLKARSNAVIAIHGAFSGKEFIAFP